MWIELLLIFIASCAYLQYKYTRKRQYWANKNIPFIPQRSIPTLIWTGLTKRKHISRWDTDTYNRFKNDAIGGGFELHNPVLFVTDPELLKCIFVRDFSHFVDRRHFDVMEMDPHLKKILTVVRGKEWKEMRSALSPTFTSGRMKRLFYIVDAIGKELVNYMKKSDSEDVNMNNVMERLSLHIITSAAFGAKSDVFDVKDSIFLQKAKRFQKVNFKGLLKLIGAYFLSFVKSDVKIGFLDGESMEFFNDFVAEAVKSRRDSKRGDSNYRDDFLQLAMEVSRGEEEEAQEESNHGEKKEKTSKALFAKEDLFGQSLLFLLAGFETVSVVLTYAVYELALNPEVQTRLQQEIDEAHDHGAITYDRVNELKYLNMVVSETLRKYPAAPRLERHCVEQYTIPNTDSIIEEGTLVIIPAYAIQMDPEYFPDPEKFDPDRFSEEQKSSILPYTYMPFGHGPRNCIGIRFALMEVKVVLAEVVRNFTLEPCAKTPIPIVLDPFQSLLRGKEPTWLKVTPRNEK